MILSPQESNLVGLCVPDNRGMRLMPLYDYYQKMAKTRHWLEVQTFDMGYPRTSYQRMEISSRNLETFPSVLDARVGPHGEERYAVMAFALSAPEVIDYAHENGVGVRLSVADNPYGLEVCNRYSPDYYRRNSHRKKKFCGTNDAVRFQLSDGKWTDVIEGGRESAKKIKKWVLTDEIETLSLEAQLPITRLRALMLDGTLDFKRQRIVHFDPHEDHIAHEDHNEKAADGLPGYGCYFGGFGRVKDYAQIVEKIETEAEVPVLKNRKIDTGDGGFGWSNTVGQIYKYDGTLANAYFLLGAKDAITLDFREEVKTLQMKVAMGIFMRGLIDMVK